MLYVVLLESRRRLLYMRAAADRAKAAAAWIARAADGQRGRLDGGFVCSAAAGSNRQGGGWLDSR
jgi:hypothetical protein